MKKNIRLLGMVSLLLAVSACNNMKPKNIGGQTRSTIDISGRFVPLFKQDGSKVEVYSPNGELIYSYIPSRLIDIDNPRSIQACDATASTEDIDIINAAIKGTIAAGNYERIKADLDNPSIAKAIKETCIAKPLLIKDISENGINTYLVPVINDRKVVAIACVAEAKVPNNTSQDRFEWVGNRVSNGSDQGIIKLDELSSHALTTQAARHIASAKLPGYSLQAINGKMERVTFLNNRLGAFDFVWLTSSPNYFVRANGNILKSIDYSVQSNQLVPSKRIVHLEVEKE